MMQFLFWSLFYILYMLLILSVLVVSIAIAGYGGNPLLGIIVFLILLAGLIKLNSTFFNIFYELEKFFKIDESPTEGNTTDKND